MNLMSSKKKLGVAYHFEEEIGLVLQEYHDNYSQKNGLYKDDLYYVSLRFRLLRQHSFFASSGLYEATYLRVHEEDILEEALELSKTKLKELVPYLAPSLAKHVVHALSRPMGKALPRMYAREFMSFYQEDEFHDQVLLKFAKLDFNILQRQHHQELSIISSYVNYFFLRLLVIPLVFCVKLAFFWLVEVYYEHPPP
ncbi:hypothetical protein Cgig2_006884 [Carnegiea gigantea]|uniref:Terpene synthase N-terminal domain-containing protein n=1 Tax=Carnegiea gigantea TaxID=171969 RepID=A0A9Q1QBN7_9CARY|nr:hypothetical protein Cgig2_006884 [Carnegiea gigantea]